MTTRLARLRHFVPPIAIWIALLGLHGRLAIAQDSPPKIPRPDLSSLPAGEVSRVIDGDTVVLRLGGVETTVRLIGVDTPETVHPQKPVELYGEEARRFLANLLTGERVHLEFEPDNTVDRYGRTLAYLFRAPDGLFVNLEIVRQGYGHAYTQYPFEHMELFRIYERRARQAGRGLWSIDLSTISTVRSGTTIDEVENAPRAPARAITVYATRTGKRYHRQGCRHLSKSQIPLTLQEARDRGLGPCSVCRPPRQ